MSIEARARWWGLLGCVAGATFIPYALVKGSVTTRIIDDGWRIGVLSPTQSANLFHALEALPLAVMALTLAAFMERVGSTGPAGRIGGWIAFTGFAATIMTHLGEHFLPPVPVAGLTGGENLLMWLYYVSWVVLFAGLAVYGFAAIRAIALPAWLPALLVGLLPLAVGFGVAAAALDVFTAAGTFRIVQGAAWVALGGWLWRSTSEPTVTPTTPVAARLGPDER